MSIISLPLPSPLPHSNSSSPFSVILPPSSLLRIPSSNIHSSLVFIHNESTTAKDPNQTSSNDRAVLRPFMLVQVSAIQRRVCESMSSIYCPLSPLQPPTLHYIIHHSYLVVVLIINMKLCNVYSSSNYRCVCVILLYLSGNF